jgi:transposase
MNDAKYIGLDVHQATISATVLDSTGKLVMESILETKAETILQFLRGLRGSLHVTFEEGTCAAWLHDLLKPRIAQVLVCDPRKNALLKVGNKNDRIDSRKLAELLRSNLLRSVFHENTGLRTMHRAAWLGKITEAGVRRRAEMYYQQLDALLLLHQQVRRELLAESHKHDATQLLRQIPSIGPIRAALLLALLQTPHRFRTKRQLWAYSGLALKTSVSGEYRFVEGQIKRSKKLLAIRGLNQNHNHDLKNIFKGAAMRAAAVAGPFQDFYAALVAKGLKPPMARLTLARKIAAITLLVWKKGVRFDAEHLKQQAA